MSTYNNNDLEDYQDTEVVMYGGESSPEGMESEELMESGLDEECDDSEVYLSAGGGSSSAYYTVAGHQPGAVESEQNVVEQEPLVDRVSVGEVLVSPVAGMPVLSSYTDVHVTPAVHTPVTPAQVPTEAVDSLTDAVKSAVVSPPFPVAPADPSTSDMFPTPSAPATEDEIVYSDEADDIALSEQPQAINTPVQPAFDSNANFHQSNLLSYSSDSAMTPPHAPESTLIPDVAPAVAANAGQSGVTGAVVGNNDELLEYDEEVEGQQEGGGDQQEVSEQVVAHGEEEGGEEGYEEGGEYSGEEEPLPCVLFHYRDVIVPMFNDFPDPDEPADQATILADDTGYDLFYSELTYSIAELKKRYEVRNDVVIQFPQLDLTINEGTVPCDTLTFEQLTKFHEALLLQNYGTVTSPRALRMIMVEQPTSVSTRLEYLQNLVRETFGEPIVDNSYAYDAEGKPYEDEHSTPGHEEHYGEGGEGEYPETYDETYEADGAGEHAPEHDVAFGDAAPALVDESTEPVADTTVEEASETVVDEAFGQPLADEFTYPEVDQTPEAASPVFHQGQSSMATSPRAETRHVSTPTSAQSTSQKRSSDFEQGDVKRVKV
ncbi:hypothetical protein HK097_008286 [Rhizophlyctis rosea]|uniref:Uncharacterized protein n=1 Tax=Rhizophlyctis rosea TaxID=64517 RepID=A0AAD5SIY0_9FUNG|nr:hypothetical protein HK097_008286 [Rhizophlyctis rosea]